MLASIWLLLLAYPRAVGATECLVGCMVQGISPFDDDSLAVWDDRGSCDSSTVGCTVSAINYPSTTFQGALWAATSGTAGSSNCTCDICDPYPWIDTTTYMSEEQSLWSRIHCFIAASGAAGYDVSPCVAAIVDTEMLPCVNDVYEPPSVDQFDCEENGIEHLTESSSRVQCIWDGDVRMAQELFSATPVSSSTTATSVAVNTNSCLVGCMVQGISPFDDDNLAVWDNRATCDPATIGCAVNTINYPSTYYFQGALWASSWGVEGSTSCTCSICDPFPWIDTTTYMSEETSLWPRIHCFLAASEAAGYDVSPCVAAIVDMETLPCVDDVYEPPSVDQFECELNGIEYLTDSSSWEQCIWDGDVRMAQELFSATPVSSSTTATSAAVNTNSCLVGCMVQGIDPFDDDNLAVWDNRATCDPATIGCAVSAINYPSKYYFQGILWASSWGVDGSTSCTCSICDPFPWSDTTTYMSEEKSLWSRIHCFLAASEAAGYDVSPCVAAIVDTETLPCVDDVYEPPSVDQFECEENGIGYLADSSSYEECNWDGDIRMAPELFSSTAASSSTTATSVVVNITSCLVGCMVQGISPFGDESRAVWDNRATCDSKTIGCAVSAINYPSTDFQGALWASSWGVDGSTSCKCNICDPYPSSDTTSYMSEEASLWSRIHCYLVASEASGYDVSPCVAAILDTGTLPCVGDMYEPPTLNYFDCDQNGITDLVDSSSYEECSWAGEYRSTDEFYGGTRAPSPQAGIESPDAKPASPSSTSPPIEGGATPPIELEGLPCGVGSQCQDNLCCHPDTNECGRKYTFCQERDFLDGPRCCSGVDGDPSASNVCSQDSICDVPEGLTRAEEAGMWIGIATGIISITVAAWKGYRWCKRKQMDKDPNIQQQRGNAF